MLTVPNSAKACVLRPRGVAAGALLSVGFVVATAVVSGDGALGPATNAAPEVLHPTPVPSGTHGASSAARNSTVNAAVITAIHEAGRSAFSGPPVGALSSPVRARPSSSARLPSQVESLSHAASPGVPGVGGPGGPVVGAPVVGAPVVGVPDVVGAGPGETTSPPDPGTLAPVTEPLRPVLEPLAPVVQTAAPVVETVAKPVTEVAAQDDGAQPALTMLAPPLL